MRPLNERLFEFIYNELGKHRPDFTHDVKGQIAASICRQCTTEGEVKAFLTAYIQKMKEH